MFDGIRKLLNKYRSIPIQAKASLWFVVCSILQRGISVITVPIFTRMMTTEQYGVYSTYISWYTLLIVFTSLNLYYGVFNNAMIKYENNRDRYISSMQGLTTTVTFFFFVVYVLFKDRVNSFLGMGTPLVLLLFVELLVTPALQFWTVHNRFDYKYRNIVYVTLIKSLLNPGLGIVLVLLSEQKDVARIVSTVLIEVIVCGTIAIYQFVKGKCFFDKEYWKYAILFNIPLLPHYLSGTILNQSDRIMISKIVGSSAVAFYSVAYNIGILMNMVTNAVASSFTPWIYKKLKEERVGEIPGITNFLLLIMFILVSLLMFMGPEVLNLIAAPEYKEAVYVIPPIAGSVFFIFMYNLFSNVEFFYEEKKYVTKGSICAAISNIILNAVLIPLFGYYAAGYTTLLCYIIYGLCHLWFTKKVAKKYLGISGIFDQKITIVLSSAVIAIVIVQNYLYENSFLRYVILLIVAICVIVKNKKIIETVRLLRVK